VLDDTAGAGGVVRETCAYSMRRPTQPEGSGYVRRRASVWRALKRSIKRAPRNGSP
jgi:hypothetical protein